jgi:FHS family L-fucose permease-like MFS transporter
MASFAVYVLGAFVAGFSMCMLSIVVNPMLNTLGGGGKRGNQLNMFGGTLNSLGGTIAPVLLGYLIGGQAATAQVADAAPAMIIAMAIFAVAFVVIMLTKIPEPHMETAEEKAARIAAKAEGKKDKYSALSFRHFILGAIAIFFYVGIEVGIPNTANLYMSGLPTVGPAIAGTVVGVYWFLMLVGRLIGASIGAKVSSKAMMIAVSALGIALMLGIIYTPETTLVTIPIVKATVPLGMFFMALAGLCTSVMWGAIFNLSTEGLGKYTPMASGIFMALVCGGGIVPFLQNLLADSVGSLNSYWLLIGCLAYLLFYALVGCKNVNKDIPVE